MPSMNSTPKDFHLTHSHFQQICGFCGCAFHVEITWRRSYSPAKSGLDTQTYSCPECRRDSRIKTSTTPKLTLLSKRTDGRTGIFKALNSADGGSGEIFSGMKDSLRTKKPKPHEIP